MGVNVSQKQDEPVLPNQWSLIHRTRQIHVNETKTETGTKIPESENARQGILL